jgi:hypothetical protein
LPSLRDRQDNGSYQQCVCLGRAAQTGDRGLKPSDHAEYALFERVGR